MLSFECRGREILMKYLYLWNDLELFGGLSNEMVEDLLREFVDYMNTVNKPICEYHLVSHDELLKWIVQIQQVCRNQNCITIGERPSRISIPEANCTNSIMLQRTIDKTGYTKKVIFKNKTENVLEECIKKFDCLHFIEDVVVNGTTLEFLFEYLRRINYHGKCIFHIFSCNEEALKRIKRKRRNFEIEIDTIHYMKGRPIQDSTLLCCYDLLYSKIDNRTYIECFDLMKTFFFDETKKFVDVICKIKEYIES